MSQLIVTRHMIKRLAKYLIFWTLLFGCVITVLSAKEAVPPPMSELRIPDFHGSPISRYAKKSPLKPISLNFTNIKVRELLQIIAQFTKLNFVINDKVGGEMSIHLQNVPWTQALDVILKSQNLGERRVGTVVYVAPVSELVKQRIEELEAKRKMSELVPLVGRVIRLHYADATAIKEILMTKESSLLSSRGGVNVDKRSNSLWVSDTPTQMNTVIRLIRQLDHPEKQILIEARIVSIRRRFERQIGVRFGLTRPSKLTGNLTGANALAQTGGGQAGVESVTLANRLNFDHPATGDIFGNTGTPGSLGLALAQLGSNFVDLELSALEEQNNLDLISSPRLVTSNKETSSIQTGEELPFESATSSGATATEFEGAVLKLEVTPQITSDNRVILKLVVSNNTFGSPIIGEGGELSVPLNVEEVQSSVLLEDNQTVVLGGIYKSSNTHVVRRVPFLGKLPLIGALFRNKLKQRDNKELLIFLTPHIISKPSDLAGS